MIPLAAARHCTAPFVAGDAPLLRHLIGEYGGAVLQLALERCDSLVDSAAPDLRHRLPGLLARPLPWAAVWDPSLAELERLLAQAEAPQQIWDGVVPLLVNLAVAGRLTEADLHLHVPQSLWWGAVRLPAADRLRFRRAGQGIALETWLDRRRFGRYRLHRSAEGGWTSRALEIAPVLWLGRHPIIVRLSDRDVSRPLRKGGRIMATVPAGTDASFAEVARLLRRVRPSPLSWVGNAVRLMVPLEITEACVSATIEEFPGLTYLSLPLTPADIARRLVHEASHHYFLALQRIAALHDGSDTTNYHSPIKERGRTIEMILFAFHAFGNGTLFHRELARRDARFAEIAGESVECGMPPLRIMHDYLARTPALTSAGRTLWQPVAERLFGAPERAAR